MKKGLFLLLLSCVLLYSALAEQNADFAEWKRVADSLRAATDFDSAIVISKLSLDAAIELYGREDTLVGRILFDLGEYYLSKRSFAEAEEYATQGLEMRQRILGANHADVATSLTQLSTIQMHEGRVSEALVNLSEVLRATLFQYDENSNEVARAYLNLAIAYKGLGDYAKADSLCVRALEIKKAVLGPDDISVALALNNMADNSDRLGDWAEAERRYLESIRIKKKQLGEYHWSTATTLNRLGLFYRSRDRMAEAEACHLEALDIETKSLGPGYPSLGHTLYSLGDLYTELHRFEEAESAYVRAINLWEEGYGESQELVLTGVDALSRLRTLQGKPDEAFALATRAAGSTIKYTLDNIAAMSEQDALRSSLAMRRSLGNFLNCFFQLPNPNKEAVDTATALVLNSKGIVSDGVFERKRALMLERDPAAAELAHELKTTRATLSRLFVSGWNGREREQYFRDRDSLEKKAIELEVALSQISASFKSMQSAKSLSAGQIESLLPDGAVLVEYLKTAHVDTEQRRTNIGYVALVVAPGHTPRLVDLGDAEPIDSLVNRLRKDMLRLAAEGRPPLPEDQSRFDEMNGALCRLIWAPVEPSIADADLTLVAPDGALNLIPFAALRADASKPYLIERMGVHYLSSGRDLVRMHEIPAVGSGLLALGDPDYDAQATDRQAATASLSRSGETNYAALRSVRSSCREFSDLIVGPLPGTRTEIQAAAEQWSDLNKGPAEVCLGLEATEDRFKSDAPGKQVIHLATHGYFLGEDCIGENALESPLLRSGLLLAGANQHGLGADSARVEDGILTASEVAEMNLEGTRLVVLSACESGLGDVRNGEGVYGLRRAFQLAGVRTQICTYWPISDQIAAEMVSGIYDRNEPSWPAWSRATQLRAIEKLRQQGQPDHPVSWGAFAVIGDWR